eukprot:TRINITY_DN7714_c1_g1_i13.p2 TRINITY_DN7714_c1_g1~~TRINITY_DN7714_c1_g1_i13.p2  ORF type:complete len:151 (+),score=7.59 TRINITY_DN7714_c1_g1_i13:200-652(+)
MSGQGDKVVVILKAVGSAPQMKQAKVKVLRGNKYLKTFVICRRKAIIISQTFQFFENMSGQGDKVVVILKAVGSAPQMKQAKVKVLRGDKFQKIWDYLKKMLKEEIVYAYLRESFMPLLEEQIGILADAYGIDNELIVHYALQPAWGPHE